MPEFYMVSKRVASKILAEIKINFQMTDAENSEYDRLMASLTTFNSLLTVQVYALDNLHFPVICGLS